MNKEKLSLEFISVVNELKLILQHTSALVCFTKNVQGSDPGTGAITAAEFFKSCIIISQDSVNRNLELSFPNWSICITVDGCATIAAAVDILFDEIGILSFNVHCSAHAAHGSMKQMAGSKTVFIRGCGTYCSNAPCFKTL